MTGFLPGSAEAKPAYSTAGEALVFFARRYSQSLGSANAFSNYIVRLRIAADVDALLIVARQFATMPEVALPAWNQVINLRSDDLGLLTEAAGAFYSHGIDVEAEHLVEVALAVDEKYIPAWQIKAALTADPEARRRIFEHILLLEPGNRVAVDNLILLGRPR